MNDSEIIDLYLQRDEAAVRCTSEQYGQRLRRLSFGIVADQQMAEECENDTYLQAWRSIPPHEPRSYFYVFLSRITRNLSIDRCRHRERMKRDATVVELSAELECCIPAPDDTACRMEAQELAKIISDFLKAQPQSHRDVFLRRYWYADDLAQIARRYHMTESKVKSMLFRTRNALRTHLEKEGYVL